MDYINFRDYCNSNKDAFDRYMNAKRGGVGLTILEYSMHKMKTIIEIKAEADIWAKKDKKH